MSVAHIVQHSLSCDTNCILGESKANGRNKGGGRVCYCELTKVSKEVQSLPASKAIVAAAEYKNAIHS